MLGKGEDIGCGWLDGYLQQYKRCAVKLKRNMRSYGAWLFFALSVAVVLIKMTGINSMTFADKKESPYPVFDTGVETNKENEPIYWMDNDTLLFYAFSEAGEGLHTYHIPSNELTFISKAREGRYCYYDKELWVNEGFPQSTAHYHIFFKEKSGRFYVGESKKKMGGARFSSKYGCTLIYEKGEGEKNYAYYLPEFDVDILRSSVDESSYLWRKPDGSTKPLKVFVKPGQGVMNFNQRVKRYIPHMDKYLVTVPQPNQDGKRSVGFAFLNRNGELVDHVKLQSPWDQTHALFPTKVGYVISSLDYRRDFDFENKRYFNAGGLFLVTGDGPDDVSGLLFDKKTAVSVSPDGCKLAVSHFIYDSRGSRYATATLKLINLCEKGVSP